MFIIVIIIMSCHLMHPIHPLSVTHLSPFPFLSYKTTSHRPPFPTPIRLSSLPPSLPFPLLTTIPPLFYHHVSSTPTPSPSGNRPPLHRTTTSYSPVPPQLNLIELCLDPRVYPYVSSAFLTRPVYHPRLTIPYSSAGRCGGHRKGQVSTSTTTDQPGRGSVLIEEDARDCDCVSVALRRPCLDSRPATRDCLRAEEVDSSIQ